MAGLWDDVENLDAHVKANLDHYIEISKGVNLQAMTNAKARAFFYHLEDTHESVCDTFLDLAERKGVLTDEYCYYLAKLWK